MAEYEIATAKGKIDVDASSIGRAVSSLDLMSNRMLLIGGVIAAGLGYAINKAADFEEQLSRFKAISVTTDSDMKKIREAALRMGQDAGIGATKVAEAFVEIAKSGIPAKDILEGVGQAAVVLAAAGEIDLARASEIVVNTLKQFHLGAGDAAHVVDLLAGAANASTSEVDDLAYSLKYAGPVAALAGISLEDTATALAIFANAGIKGSTAGTSMRGMLLGLTAQTPKAAKVLKELNIITADGVNTLLDQNGALKPLPEVFEILRKNTEHLSRAEKINKLNAIFQRRALTAAAVAAYEGAGGFEAARKEVEKTKAYDVMQEKLNNLKGDWARFKAAMEQVAIIIGSTFIPVLRDAAQKLKELANWFSELDPETQKTIAQVLLFAGAAFIAFGVMGKLASILIKSWKALRDLGGAFKLVKGIIPGLSKGLGAIRSGLQSLRLAWMYMSEAVIANTVALLANPITWVVVAVLALGAALAAGIIYWKEISAWVKSHMWLAAILAVISPVLAAFVALGVALGWLKDHWREVWAWIKQAAKDLVAWVDQAVTDVLTFFRELPGKVASFLSRLPGMLLRLFENLAKGAWNAFGDLVGLLAYAAGYIIGWILGTAVKMLIEGAKLTLSLIEGIASAMPGLIQFFLDLPLNILKWLGDLIGWLAPKGVDLLVGLFNGLMSWLGNVISFWVELPGKIADWLGDVVPTLLSKGKDILMGFWRGAIEIATQLGVWMAELPGLLLRTMGDVGSTFLSVGRSIVDGIWEGIKGAAGWLTDKIESFAGGLLDGALDALGIGSASRVMMPVGEGIILGWGAGMESEMSGLMKQVDRSAQALSARASVSTSASFAGQSFRAAAVTPELAPAASRGRQTTINNDNKFYGLDPKETAKAVIQESVWQERTTTGGSL